MEFAFTDEQNMIAETVRDFFRENATSQRTRAAMDGDGIDHALWGSFGGEMGLAGAAIPETYGGAGLAMVELAIIAEAAGAQIAAIPLLGNAMVGAAIAGGGSDPQKESWLPRIAAGEIVCAYGWSEDAVEQNGALAGTTPFVPHGGSADLLMVASPEGMWLIEANAAGVAIETPVTMDQIRPLANVTFDGAPCERLDDNDAARTDAFAAGCIVLSAEALGGAQEALDRTVAFSKERVQFGRLIGSYQAYKHRLADMMVEIEQARSAVYWAACAVDERSADRELALHSAKSFSADTFFNCAGNMIQLHGGIGFTWEHDAHLYFKRARSIQTMLGSNDWHREQIARIAFGEAA